MRRSLWTILAVLFVAVGTPNSHADSFTPIFTCGLCTSALPTAPDVSFPAPIAIDITWENTLFDFTLPSGQPTDFYNWMGVTPPGPSQIAFATLTIFTGGTTNAVVAPFIFRLDGNNNCLDCAVIDNGRLQFAPAETPSVPEPSSVVPMLAGIGFLLVMMPKRLASGNVFVRSFSRLALLVILAATTLAARADTVHFVLTQPIQSGAPGSTLTYAATVTAAPTNTVDIFLNGVDFNVDGPFTLVDSPFFVNFPFFLTPGQSFTGDLFDIQIPVDAAPGIFNSSFALLGGANGGASDVLGIVNFQTDVTAATAATPEPSTFALLGTGILGLAGTARRKFLSHS